MGLAVFFDLGLAELALVIAFVVLGGLTQGSIGLGFGLVVVPALAVLAPDALPATPLLITLPLTAMMVARERHAVDTDGLPSLLAGRVAGTVLAVLLLRALSQSSLEILFGTVILVVTAVSMTRARVRPTLPGRLIAASASGLFGTTTSIGGPPIALLYQGRPGPELRATLGSVFFFGGLISALGMLAAGRLGLVHVLFAVALALPMTVGFALSRYLARFLDRGWLRPAVLAFAAGGGVLAIARGLTG